MRIDSAQAFPVSVMMREELIAGSFTYPDFRTALVMYSSVSCVLLGFGLAYTQAYGMNWAPSRNTNNNVRLMRIAYNSG